MTDALLAVGAAVCCAVALGVLGWGAWAIVTDRPLNPERSTDDPPR